MRASFLAVSLVVIASPAMAQTAAPPPETVQLPPELTDMRWADRLSDTMVAMSKAFLNLPVGEVEAAAAEGLDPASERARALAARWEGLIEEFTGGDPGIRENLSKLYADQANWPSTFRKPYSDEASAFIGKVKAARDEEGK